MNQEILPYSGMILRDYFNLPKELILIILQYSCNVILPERNVIYMYEKINSFAQFHILFACKPYILNDTRKENDHMQANIPSHTGNILVDQELQCWTNGTIIHKISESFQSTHIQIVSPYNNITDSYTKYHKKYIKFPSDFITKKEIYQWIKGHKIKGSMKMKKDDLLNSYIEGIKKMN